jgi:hypothetical protein
MSFVIILYKAIFNFIVKKDGYNQLTHILSTAIISLFFFIFVINISTIISFIFKNPFYSNLSKGFVWSCIVIFVFSIYLFIFKYLNISVNGDTEDFLFKLSSSENVYALSFIIINVILIISLLSLKTIYFRSS